mgnify:CR=1 FL=1
MRRFPTACWLLCTVALAGCDSSASSEPPPVATIEPEPKQTSQPLPGPEIDPDPRALMMRLAPHAVSDDNFVRRVLYTWTTAEQAKEVRQDKQLLRRSNDAEGKIAWFDAQIRKRSDRMSKLLQTPPFDKRRFAWTRPWATSMGGYGDVLVRMELKPDAVIGNLETSDKQS